MPLPTSPGWRIAIAGGGPTGLALALALARRCGAAVAVTIHDPGFAAAARPDGRAYALSAASIAFLTELGILPGLAGEPIAGMAITDGRLSDALRQTYLRFEAGPDGRLGLMVEGAPLVGALQAACEAAGIGLKPDAILSGRAGPDAIAVATSGGQESRAALLVACDGARSRLRDEAGIGWTGGRHRQVGLVATIRHALPHGGWATQHFLPAGPFAILPLPDGPDRAHRSSIVWTETPHEARRVQALPAGAAFAELERRFGPELGAIEILGPLAAFPLAIGLARDFAAARLALVGDAAHAIHPLAGQGLNLALADADALASRVAASVSLGLDPGRPEVLRAYERDRRTDAVTLAALTDGLDRLFSNDLLPIRALRDIGLGLVDRAPGAKRFLAGRAAGRPG